MNKVDELGEVLNRYDDSPLVPAYADEGDGETPSKPHRQEPQAPRGDWQRITFICYPEDIKLIRAISLLDNRKVKETIHGAFKAYIEGWEREHPNIDLSIFK